MKGIRKIALFGDASAVCRTEKGFLVKRKEDIVHVDGEGRILARLPEKGFVHKLVLSKDGKVFLTLSGLFQEKVYLYSLEQMEILATFDFQGGKSLVLDAFFLPDDSLLFFLQNEKESYLVQTRLDGKKRTFFQGEGRRFDQVFFDEVVNAVLLLSKEGHVAFLAEGKIAKEFSIPKVNCLSPLGKGNVLLASSPQGFYLLSGNGRILRRLDFLLPENVEGKERENSFVLDRDHQRILYLSRQEKNSALYLFSSKDFELLDYKIERKKETKALGLEGKYLYLQGDGRIMVGKFVD